MDQKTWLTAKNPLHLLLHIRRTSPGLRSPARRRKARLFACACVRRIWESLKHPELRNAVETVEGFAESEIKADCLMEARATFHHLNRTLTNLWGIFYRLTDAQTWSAVKVWRDVSAPILDRFRGNKSVEEKALYANYVRCIFGNPFEPVAFERTWRTSDVMLLAQGIYNDRAFDRMPILADALQDAGCYNDDILNHCRDTNALHARGCWVVDLVLSKS